MERTIAMSVKELERITVMDDLLTKRIKQKHAAKKLGLSIRQIRRLKRRYKDSGAKGLIHKSRGRKSNREIDRNIKAQAIDLIRKYYPDFGPTLAHEKLVEFHGINFGVDTLRKEMVNATLWKSRKRKIKDIHPYRERKSCVGELIQLDGSPHRWFEDRGVPCTLIAFIDDATSRIMDGCFVDYEGTWTLFEATAHYLSTYGKPLSFYVDKHSTFKINRQASVEEDLRNKQAQSQFSRAMDNLGIEVIFANSPQAKGRVERLFETLQDRLIKELRLKGISSKGEATKYFREIYIPVHNGRFAVVPKEKADMHRSLLSSDNLARIFTVMSKRIITKDLIVRYRNTRYQLLPDNGCRYTLRNTAVTILEDKTGRITFEYKNKNIPYQIAIKEIYNSKPVLFASSKEFNERRITIPCSDHPWKRVFYASQREIQTPVVT